jgi:hypothetical protein
MGEEKGNPTNFRRKQFPILSTGKAVMGFLVGTNFIESI